MKNIFKGNMYYADLEPVVGSEEGGSRPVIVVQNNVGNKYSTTILVAPITSKKDGRTKIPTHIELKAKNKIKHDSIILLEQVRVIDKVRLKSFLGRIEYEQMKQLDAAIIAAFGIDINNYMIELKNKGEKYE